ncbi:MAG TPA: aminomethyltransferase, partial [Rhodospirillaceae bacterium]|nr:aminomethyltransferase [Rhodospirillaceae bacterium]
MKEHARVVIIGGGMMGCGLLYHLAQEGWTDSLLIEKGELTSGSTWHAAGQCPSFIADYNMAKIHHYGNTLYPKLEAMTGQYVSWHGCGGLRFATNRAELDYFKKVEGTAKLIGFRMQVIGPDEIKAINPHVDTTGVLAAAWTLDDGHVDPAGCCNALAKGARDRGAEIERRNRVLNVVQLPSGEWQVVTEKGTVTCEHVVNAGGCYARLINQWVGSDVPITNMKHHYIVTEPIQQFIDADVEMPVMRDPYPSAYYRQEQKSGLIGIYETEGSQEAWADRGGYPEWDSENELFTDELDRISPWVERTLERMPIWGESGIKRIVHGAIPHTPDANPLLGPTAGLRNFWQCCGSSIGIAQGAGCGKYLAQWIVHGQSEINMAGLDPRRFGRWADADYVRARSIEDYEHMYALHLPGEERPAGRGKRKSSLYDILAEAGGLYTTASGWE